MIWHGGYLADNPDRSRQLRWIRTSAIWNLPDDVRHEFVILFNMPGFAVDYHKNMVRKGRQYVEGYIAYAQERLEEVKPQIIENWLSITREDAVLLAQRRPWKGKMPLICKLFMAEDKERMRTCDIMRDYNCSHTTILKNKRFGPFNRTYGIPSWFLENTPH